MLQSAPVPFRQFVLKVHSRCDLSCNHCYMYEHADQSWKSRPRILALDTAALVGKRVAEHARTHGLASVVFVLHGGEPLLAGVDHLEAIIKVLQEALAGVADVDLRIHTNGVRLDEQFCDLFLKYDVKVGVSLDGDRVANDRHRRYADGRTSHPQVLKALELLRSDRYRHLYVGLLCTVDVANDPIAVYEALLAEQPPRVDLLLPHATWDAPPSRPLDPATGEQDATAYADWLIAVHDRWVRDGRPMGIRTFDSVYSTLRGGPSLTEALGLTPTDLLVIETDGQIEQVDSLKVAFDGAPGTGLTVLADSLDVAAAHPGVRARQLGAEGLCQTCRDCPVLATCGGGLYPHRYKSATVGDDPFLNPSVYCADLKKLIEHLAAARRVPASVDGGQRHVVERGYLTEVAGGFGGASAVRALTQVQASISRRLLVGAAAALMPDDWSSRAAWQVLTEIDASHGEALAEALAHPYFRSWAVRIRSSSPRGGDADYLTGIAVAAAVRAGIEIDLPVVPRQGAIHLPTLGTFRVDAGSSPIRIGTEPGVVVLRAGSDRYAAAVDGSEDTAQGRWLAVGHVRSKDFALRLEDLDPERDCYQRPVAGRLSAEDRVRWQDAFDTAWQLILSDHPAYADGLVAGLSTLTPLAPSANGHEISAAARHAPGAVAAALPASADHLALLLIHEFQHVKLGAVLDAYDLFDMGDENLYYAPWRDDPRPLEGLLQGTYAHIAVTDFWRVRRKTADGAEAEAAERHFARWRTQTAEAVEVLAGSGSLTPLGLMVADAMRTTLAPWLAEAVDQRAEAAARRSSDGHRAAYEAHLLSSTAV